MAVALHEIITERVLSRPSILEATRVCGLTDSEIARLLGSTPMQVNDWAKQRRPIPKVKFVALWLVVHTLRGMIGRAPESPHTGRAHLLHDAVGKFADLAMAETFGGKRVPMHVFEPAADLANQALAKLGGGYVTTDVPNLEAQ